MHLFALYSTEMPVYDCSLESPVLNCFYRNKGADLADRYVGKAFIEFINILEKLRTMRMRNMKVGLHHVKGSHFRKYLPRQLDSRMKPARDVSSGTIDFFYES